MNLKRFQELKDRLEELKTEQAKSEGAIAERQTRLKIEFGCTTIRQARKLLSELEAEEETETAKFQKALQKFEDEYGQ